MLEACPERGARYRAGVTVSGLERSRPWRVVVVIAALALPACKRNYRVGEYVMVQWDKETRYPAYIVDKREDGRYRVHFDRMDSRWDEDVTLDRIKEVLRTPVTPPPPPQSVRDATERLKPPQASSAAPLARYQAGDHVKVQWRGTKYDATIRSVVTADQFLVHYEGYEDAYDEKVGVDRIVGRR